MFDTNNRIEDLKCRDKLAALEREFPGESCGNAECENLCAEALHIAKAMRLDPKIMIEDSIRQSIVPKTQCVPTSAEFTPPFFTAPCRFGFVRSNDHLALSESSNDSSNVFRAKPGSCEKCQSCDGITVLADKMQDEDFMQSLGFWKQKDGVFRPHPNCDCKWVKKESQKTKSLSSLQEIVALINVLNFVWKHKIPKPPRITDHKGQWLELVWMWFFEQGSNPITFDKNSEYSQDIANSYSMKILKEQYKKDGRIPRGWQYTGPDTAKYVLGEVEWFVGSYDIQDFQNNNGVITFRVHNVTSWRSGTRLPKSWTNYIKEMTGYEITELVTSAPRGQTLQSKIKTLIPSDLLKNPASRYIINRLLNALPSFGGNWEQYFEIEVIW